MSTKLWIGDKLYIVPEEVEEYVEKLEAENKGLRHCLEKAVQLAEIACDWNLCEVEIDEDMVSTYTLKEGFEQALKGGE
jgi:hypothetical protein